MVFIRPSQSALLKRMLLFLCAFAALQWAWGQARGSAIERLVIDGATVRSAVAIIRLITPQLNAQTLSSRIQAPGGGINIINGCEGTDVLFLLAAAVLAYGAAWRHRLAGLLAGSVLVFVLNQVRVTALFYSYLHDRELFSQLHGFVLPLLLISAAFLYFIAWAQWCQRD